MTEYRRVEKDRENRRVFWNTLKLYICLLYIYEWDGIGRVELFEKKSQKKKQPSATTQAFVASGMGLTLNIFSTSHLLSDSLPPLPPSPALLLPLTKLSLRRQKFFQPICKPQKIIHFSTHVMKKNG